MEWNYRVPAVVALISLVAMAGCTGPSPAPVATPMPLPVTPAVIAVTASPVMTAPVMPVSTWTTETPYPGHPYTKTYSFHGSGDYEDFTFSTDHDAAWECTLTYPKEGVFTVILKDARSREIQVLANEGGGGTSRKTVSLAAGDYSFDIKADAPWYITLSTG
jgi:hypothetical protein